MYTLVALFCEVANPSVCVPAVPPIIFPNSESCYQFAVAEQGNIDLTLVTYDYQCVGWDKI
jgi:hypothetical protein